MVKKENVQNASNSLLQTATNRKLGASRLALTAFRSGARPPVKRVRVKSGDSRVSDLTVSVAENVLPAVVHEIHVGDIDVDSSIFGMSLNSSSSSVSGQGKKKTTQSIGRAVKTTPQPRAYVAPSQIATKRPVVKKSMDLQNGIKFVAPSPMTLDRVQVQMGQERNAPESKEYKLQQEEVREKQESELIRQEAEEMKLQLKKQIEEALGEGFEAQLEDFDTKRVTNPVAAAAVKKKSLVKKIFNKIRHKSPGKLGDGKPKPITAAEARLMARKALMDASKQRRLQGGMQGATMINNQYLAPRFPISEIVTHAKDDSISDLDASVRRFPVNEIVTNGLEQARDDETISTLGTPQIFDKLDRFLDQRDTRQPGGDTPFESQESGQQFLKLLEVTDESRLRHRLGSALVDQMDSLSALSNHADATAATDDTGAIEVVMGRCNPTSVEAHKDPKTGQIVVKRMSPVDCALAAICAPPVALSNAMSNSAKNVDHQRADMPSVLKSSGPLSPVREEMRSPSSGQSPSSANTGSPRKAALSPTSKFNFAIDEAIRKVQTQMKRNDLQVGQETESINAVVDGSINRLADSGEDSDRYSIPDLETDKKNQLLAQNVSADFMTSFARMGSDLCNPTANQTSSSQVHNRKHPRVSSSGVIDLTAIESGTFVEDDVADAFVGEEGHMVHWEDQQATHRRTQRYFESPRRDNAFQFDDLMDIAESKLASSNEGMGSDDRYSVENDISPRQVILGQHVDGNAPDGRVPIVRGIDIRASNRRSTNEATPKASGANKSPKKRETVIDGGFTDNEVEIYYNPTCESIQEAVNPDGVLKTLMNSFSFRSRSMDQTSPKSQEGDEDLSETRRKADLDTVKQNSRRKVSPRSRTRKPTPGDLRSPSKRHSTEEPTFLPSSPNERSTATNAFAGFFSDGLFDLLSGDDSTMTKEAILTSRGESCESGEPILSQGTTEMGGKSYEDGLSQTSTAASSTAIIKEGSDPKIGMMCGAVPLYLLYSTKPATDDIDEKPARRKESESPRQDSSPANLASAQTNPRKTSGKLPPGKISSPRLSSRIQQKEEKSYPEPKTGSYDSSLQREEGSGTFGNPYTVPTDEDAECKENKNSKPETTSTSPCNAQKITASPTRKQNQSPRKPTENLIPTNQVTPSNKNVKARKRGAPIPDDTQQSRSRTALVRNEGGLNSSLPTDGAGAKNLLLDHDDAYWDTLSTIASTRDRSIEKPLKKVNPMPGPIPVEITMKKKSEADEAKSSSLNKQKKLGCSDDPNEKVYEKVLSPSHTNAPQAAVERQEGALDRRLTKEDIECKENNKSMNVMCVSRFGSGIGDDLIDAPPSRSLSGLPGNEKEQVNSDATYPKSSRVANLIAKFEAARTELKGKLGMSDKKQKSMIHARSQDDHGKSTQSPMDTGRTTNGVSNRSVSWGFEEIFEPVEPRQTETKPQSMIDFNRSGGEDHRKSYAPKSSSGDAYNDVPLSYSLSEGHIEESAKEIQRRSSDPLSHTTESSGSEGYIPVARSYSALRGGPSTPHSSGSEGYLQNPAYYSSGSEGYEPVSRSYSEREFVDRTRGPVAVDRATTHSGGSGGYYPDPRSYSTHDSHDRANMLESGRNGDFVPLEGKFGDRDLSTLPQDTLFSRENPATRSSGSEGLGPLERSYSPIPVRGSIPMQNDRNKGFEGDFDGSSSRSDDSPYSLYEKLPDTISPRPEHEDGEVLGDKKIPQNSNPLPSLSQDWALPETGDSRGYQDTNARVSYEQRNQRSPHSLFESKYEHTKESLRRNGSPLGNMSSSSQSDFSSGSEEDLRGNTPQLDGTRSSRHGVLESSSEGRSGRDGQVPPEIIQKPLLIAAAAGKGLMAAASAALFANREISSPMKRSITPSQDEKDEYESKVEILGKGHKSGDEIDQQMKTPTPLVVDDESTKVKEAMATKSSKVIDLTEHEDTTVKNLTVEEEQNLITRTLELSKAILSSVNAQSPTMSDEEIAKSILSLESEDIARSLLSLETNDGVAKGTTPTGLLNQSLTDARSKFCPANVTVPISVTVQSPGKGSTTLNHSIQSLLKTDRVVNNLDQESTGGTTPSISLSTASQYSTVDINALFSKYDDVAHHLIHQNDQLKTIAKEGSEKKDFSDSEHTSDILNKLQELREQRSRAMSRFKAVHGHGSVDGSTVTTEDRDPPVSTSLTSNSQRERNRLTRYTSDNGSTLNSRLESGVEKPRSKSSSRGYMFERPLNLDERQRAKSADRSRLSDTNDTRDIESVSTSSCSTRTTASKKARDLRKQLDEALRTSQQIRQSQEKLGSELRSFKQRFYERNNELEDQAFQAMGGMN